MPVPPKLLDAIDAIMLTGFMGAGKTTVGRLLAERIGWRFLDLDHEIEQRAGRTVAEIFHRDGEAGFRRLEAETLGELLGQASVVIGLGGGAIETPEVRALITRQPRIVLVYLAAPLEVLLRRCTEQPQAAVRPVLADRERLKIRWENRRPHYERAHLRIETENLTPGQVAGQIIELLGARETLGQER
jgi:shikimate kinase